MFSAWLGQLALSQTAFKQTTGSAMGSVHQHRGVSGNWIMPPTLYVPGVASIVLASARRRRKLMGNQIGIDRQAILIRISVVISGSWEVYCKYIC